MSENPYESPQTEPLVPSPSRVFAAVKMDGKLVLVPVTHSIQMYLTPRWQRILVGLVSFIIVPFMFLGMMGAFAVGCLAYGLGFAATTLWPIGLGDANWEVAAFGEMAMFGAVPQIGDALMEFVRGDFYISDITLNRFFALHVCPFH